MEKIQAAIPQVGATLGTNGWTGEYLIITTDENGSVEKRFPYQPVPGVFKTLGQAIDAANGHAGRICRDLLDTGA